MSSPTKMPSGDRRDQSAVNSNCSVPESDKECPQSAPPYQPIATTMPQPVVTDHNTRNSVTLTPLNRAAQPLSSPQYTRYDASMKQHSHPSPYPMNHNMAAPPFHGPSHSSPYHMPYDISVQQKGLPSQYHRNRPTATRPYVGQSSNVPSHPPQNTTTISYRSPGQYHPNHNMTVPSYAGQSFVDPRYMPGNHTMGQYGSQAQHVNDHNTAAPRYAHQSYYRGQDATMPHYHRSQNQHTTNPNMTAPPASFPSAKYQPDPHNNLQNTTTPHRSSDPYSPRHYEYPSPTSSPSAGNPNWPYLYIKPEQNQP